MTKNVTETTNLSEGDPTPNLEAAAKAAHYEEVDAWLDTILGHSEADVLKALDGKTPFRVTNRDGQNFVGLANMNPDRINLVVVRGKVTKAHRG